MCFIIRYLSEIGANPARHVLHQRTTQQAQTTGMARLKPNMAGDLTEIGISRTATVMMEFSSLKNPNFSVLKPLFLCVFPLSSPSKNSMYASSGDSSWIFNIVRNSPTFISLGGPQTAFFTRYLKKKLTEQHSLYFQNNTLPLSDKKIDIISLKKIENCHET
jgi:hypothetical protein